MTARKRGKRQLTLEKECRIDSPYANCCRNRNLIPVPDRNSGKLDEHLIWMNRCIVEVLFRTYIRRTTNSEEENVAKKANV